MADLKFRIPELREQAESFLAMAKTKSLPVDVTANDLTNVLLAFEPVVVARARKQVEEFLAEFCPEAQSQIDWQRLFLVRSAVPLPDVDLLFMQPIPNPVPLCK